MNDPKLIDAIAAAIQKADSSYFNENYTKQAQAAFAVIEKSGYALVPKELPHETWTKVADTMKTGRIRPEEHVKDVYEKTLAQIALK
ncbi:MAG: hypothetical protein B7X02_01015 [Rhodospirillales bacterium 12-54-5]|nr:MAG: hypothetical protein B7X02_01015 [Rhodospirillales bacterium 12-54-5]